MLAINSTMMDGCPCLANTNILLLNNAECVSVTPASHCSKHNNISKVHQYATGCSSTLLCAYQSFQMPLCSQCTAAISTYYKCSSCLLISQLSSVSDLDCQTIAEINSWITLHSCLMVVLVEAWLLAAFFKSNLAFWVSVRESMKQEAGTR